MELAAWRKFGFPGLRCLKRCSERIRTKQDRDDSQDRMESDSDETFEDVDLLMDDSYDATNLTLKSCEHSGLDQCDVQAGVVSSNADFLGEGHQALATLLARNNLLNIASNNGSGAACIMFLLVVMAGGRHLT